LGLRLVEASLRLGEQKGAFCKGLILKDALRPTPDLTIGENFLKAFGGNTKSFQADLYS
jgi:hypothetical protein